MTSRVFVRSATPLVTTLLVTTLIAATRFAGSAYAQDRSPQTAPASPVGVWRGTSLCLVRPSPCNDEVVVYRITSTRVADSLSIDARKIVRGEEQEMGVLGCRVASGALTCTIAPGTWQFRVVKDSLIGELRLNDHTKFRDVRATRSETRTVRQSTGAAPSR